MHYIYIYIYTYIHTIYIYITLYIRDIYYYITRDKDNYNSLHTLKQDNYILNKIKSVKMKNYGGYNYNFIKSIRKPEVTYIECSDKPIYEENEGKWLLYSRNNYGNNIRKLQIFESYDLIKWKAINNVNFFDYSFDNHCCYYGTFSIIKADKLNITDPKYINTRLFIGFMRFSEKKLEYGKSKNWKLCLFASKDGSTFKRFDKIESSKWLPMSGNIYNDKEHKYTYYFNNGYPLKSSLKDIKIKKFEIDKHKYIDMFINISNT